MLIFFFIMLIDVINNTFFIMIKEKQHLNHTIESHNVEYNFSMAWKKIFPHITFCVKLIDPIFFLLGLFCSVTNRHNKNQTSTNIRQHRIQALENIDSKKYRHFANAWKILKIGVQIWRKRGGKGVKEKGQQGKIERLDA